LHFSFLFQKPHHVVMRTHDIDPGPQAPSEAWSELEGRAHQDEETPPWFAQHVEETDARFSALQDALRAVNDRAVPLGMPGIGKRRARRDDDEITDPDIASGDPIAPGEPITEDGPPPGAGRILSTGDINAANRHRHNRPTRDNPPPIKALVDLSAAWKRKYPRPRTAKDPNNGAGNSFRNANRV
jgi:hypothetical protein